MDGWVNIDKDGYYVLQLNPPVGTTLTFNDSLLLRADEKTANMRQAIVLPLRAGKYALKVQQPNGAVQAPIYFGMYYSATGQDEFWNNPVVKW